MNWFTLYKHLTLNTQLDVVSETDDYRKLARTLPTKNDWVLEVGCSVGLATRDLAHSANKVTALDHSITQLEDARDTHADLTNVEWLSIDARDVSEIKLVCPTPNIIFMDIGGNIQLGNISSALRLYLNNFTPRALVIKSIELAILANLIGTKALPIETTHLRKSLNPEEQRLQDLLSLSMSDMPNDRVFAARQLRSLNHPLAKNRLKELAENDQNAKVRRISSD